jgi:ribosomal protein S18 acetylase RimI-like enzyme
MSRQNETINLRPATEEDFPFIEQMCYESAFPDGLGEKDPFEEVRNEKWFRDYTGDWPNHEGDFGLIAENSSGKPLGAAWYRDFPRKDLSADIPTHELSIAIVPEARGQHIGTKLMLGLLDGAAQRGLDKLVLQVRPENERAKALYQKIGFVTVENSAAGYDVMVAPTSTESPK